MKGLTLTATFLILCVAGASAQTAEKQIKQLPPIEKKELDLSYLGKDSTSVLERIKEKDVESRYLKKREDVNAVPNKKEPEQHMPILQPDASIQFHILAKKPDSTILYHMQIKKPH